VDWSLHWAHLPIKTWEHCGHKNDVLPLSTSLMPQEVHLSALSNSTMYGHLWGANEFPFFKALLS
jgi:hypothetical protein